jgi:PAS domain-containing protein
MHKDERNKAVLTEDNDQLCTLLDGDDGANRRIIETINEAALTVSLDGVIRYCNQRFCDLVKSSIQDTISQNLAAFVALDQGSVLGKVLTDAQTRPVQHHLTLRATDGVSVSVQLAASLLASDNNLRICLVLSDQTFLEAQNKSIRTLRKQKQTLEDIQVELQSVNVSLCQSRSAALRVAEDAIIAQSQSEKANTELRREATESKKSEEALRLKETELSEAQQLTHVGKWYWEAKTDIVTGSNELLLLYGFDPATQSMPNFSAQKGLCFPDEEWERLNSAVQQALQDGDEYELDVQAIRNGALIWVTICGETVNDIDGGIVGIRGTVQEITAHKKAENALQECQKQNTFFADELEGD